MSLLSSVQTAIPASNAYSGVFSIILSLYRIRT